MSAYALNRGETLKIDRSRETLVVRTGNVWLTQHRDAEDHMMRAGESLRLNGEGTTLIKAYEPTLLELYQLDPAAVRSRIAQAARRERSEDVHAFLSKIFTGLCQAYRRLRAQPIRSY